MTDGGLPDQQADHVRWRATSRALEMAGGGTAPLRRGRATPIGARQDRRWHSMVQADGYALSGWLVDLLLDAPKALPRGGESGMPPPD
ncbi:hypothetical protein GCM10022214_00690 [Actinomadura miaoliensis]|uniref:Uncharacterized protein n=1 Tax=Actinomadura miaoliensis TaxID=430685 RepID=A0ABP7UVL0_9ACTN